MLKEEFDLLLNHEWDEKITECIKETYKNLLSYKYLISKITIENISKLLKLANSIKIDLQLKEIEISCLKQEIEELKKQLNLKK
jgi:hypothetical protein